MRQSVVKGAAYVLARKQMLIPSIDLQGGAVVGMALYTGTLKLPEAR